MLMIRPTVEGEAFDKLKGNIVKLIEDSDGEVIHEIDLGVRSLAYRIATFSEARYMVYYFSGDGKAVNEITNYVNLSDTILRQLTVKAEGEIPSPSLQGLVEDRSHKIETEEEVEAKKDEGDEEEGNGSEEDKKEDEK